MPDYDPLKELEIYCRYPKDQWQQLHPGTRERELLIQIIRDIRKDPRRDHAVTSKIVTDELDLPLDPTWLDAAVAAEKRLKMCDRMRSGDPQ